MGASELANVWSRGVARTLYSESNMRIISLDFDVLKEHLVDINQLVIIAYYIVHPEFLFERV